MYIRPSHVQTNRLLEKNIYLAVMGVVSDLGWRDSYIFTLVLLIEDTNSLMEVIDDTMLQHPHCHQQHITVL